MVAAHPRVDTLALQGERHHSPSSRCHLRNAAILIATLARPLPMARARRSVGVSLSAAMHSGPGQMLFRALRTLSRASLIARRSSPRTSKDGAHSGLTGTAGRVKDSLSRSFAACSGTLLVARVLELRGARKSKAGPRLLALAGMASGRADRKST